MKNVVIYTKEYCPYCKRAIALLEEKSVSYKKIDVTDDFDTFREVIQKTGWDTVPQIFIEDKFIGGCDDMVLLEKQGNLDKLLNGEIVE
ncbi:glutaredoxin 3 [Alkaliphilus peptidifermentans]|uniref:Glutaredoxin n=1 Tax=Alkaliphilus peptidifermentans DSM 18978 TaxID=1120976 RepID=A0A1G5J2L7_9FIRM|nr:glutaredoxin 3 [Alkaliphilus peptidifermentans]SCY82507.1 glutaredoxin 3 [Alkaliphilus peptidifermentans DSM 18978]